MENEKAILSSDLTLLANSVKAIIQEQFQEALKLETNAYKGFLDSYNDLFSSYHSAFKSYQDEQHKGIFLFKNIQLHNQLKEAFELHYDQNEPLYFPQALQNVCIQTLHIFSNLYQDSGNSIYKHIQKTEDEQFSNKFYLTRKIITLKSKLHKNDGSSQKETIHSFLNFFYQETISSVIEENREKLFAFYQELANLDIDIWNAILNNTAFIRKLHESDYRIKSLDENDLVWKLDELPGERYKKIENRFADFLTNFSSEVEAKILNFNFSTFIEQKRKFLVLDEIELKIQKGIQNAEKSNILWRTTRFTFTEDRCLEIEIVVLELQIVQKTLEFIHKLDTSFNDPFYNNLREFELQFDTILDDLNKDVSKNFEKNPDETLTKLKLQLKKELLIKSLPKIRNHLNSSNIIKEIDDFETTTVNSFALSKTRLLMKIPDYTRKVNPNELELISPNDLIAFEIKPTFIRVFPALKRAVIEHTQNILNKLETAPSVTIFSIESASQYFKEHKKPKEVINICVEGIKRSKAKLTEAGESNKVFTELEKEKLQKAIRSLIDSVTEITNNESAFQIKLRIVKAKAIGRSKEVKEKIKSKIISFLPELIKSIQSIQTFIVNSSQKLSKHFLFEKASGFIATDISDYLSHSQATIAKLPYIYQRLFSFEPLETFELYVEREALMEKMELAFSKWKEEKFAPVVIVGEKGSGKTTFIRKFLKTKVKNETIFEIDLLENNKTPEELYSEISEQVNLKKAVSGEKKVIVLDGLERLYESKINGFEFLFKLFKVISDTQKDIFWIVSVHNISWNFLDKSIDASNYFGYHIHLSDLDFEELYELIETRHKLSGYPLLFGETQKKKSILGSKPNDSAEQQELFMKDYLGELNKAVQGNILQTFIYWMCSASLVENKTIYIKSEYNLDFDFVRSIPSEKLLLLRHILVHNGLNVKRLAKFARVGEEQMELQVQQFVDDGILTFSNNAYFITPLIYKQVIKYLKDINLLH